VAVYPTAGATAESSIPQGGPHRRIGPPGGGHTLGFDSAGGGHTVGFTSHKCSSQRSRGRGHIRGSDPRGGGTPGDRIPRGGPHRRIRSSRGATPGDRLRIRISRRIRIYMPNGFRVWIGGLYCVVYWEEGLWCALIKSTLGSGNPGRVGNLEGRVQGGNGGQRGLVYEQPRTEVDHSCHIWRVPSK
jgi:hypothetical protein